MTKPWGLSGNVRILPEGVLKKIEERYYDTEEGVVLFREGYYSPRPASSAELDVRKLALALDKAADILRRQGWPTCAAEAERTLEEVAGG